MTTSPRRGSSRHGTSAESQPQVPSLIAIEGPDAWRSFVIQEAKKISSDHFSQSEARKVLPAIGCCSCACVAVWSEGPIPPLEIAGRKAAGLAKDVFEAGRFFLASLVDGNGDYLVDIIELPDETHDGAVHHRCIVLAQARVELVGQATEEPDTDTAAHFNGDGRFREAVFGGNADEAPEATSAPDADSPLEAKEIGLEEAKDLINGANFGEDEVRSEHLAEVEQANVLALVSYHAQMPTSITVWGLELSSIEHGMALTSNRREIGFVIKVPSAPGDTLEHVIFYKNW
jgi:hypothetical protein